SIHLKKEVTLKTSFKRLERNIGLDSADNKIKSTGYKKELIKNSKINEKKAFSKSLYQDNPLKIDSDYLNLQDKKSNVYTVKAPYENAREQSVIERADSFRMENLSRLKLDKDGVTEPSLISKEASYGGIIGQAYEHLAAKAADPLRKSAYYRKNSIGLLMKNIIQHYKSNVHKNNSYGIVDEPREVQFLLNHIEEYKIQDKSDLNILKNNRNQLTDIRLFGKGHQRVIRRGHGKSFENEVRKDQQTVDLESYNEDFRNSMAADIHGIYRNQATKTLRNKPSGRVDTWELDSDPVIQQENAQNEYKGYVHKSRLIFNLPPKTEETDVSSQNQYSNSAQNFVSLNAANFDTKAQQKKLSDLGQNEINILADQVLKILDKRISIQKDRRGML
ncbi:MAG: hypothetical protein Q8942_09645, partial [Bacillota bacterium]|nr:hypothetical protein [Bacillota bacterium]